MARLNVGIVGLRHGMRHIPEFLKIQGVEIGAISDLRADLLEAAGLQYNIPESKRYQDIESLLALPEIDAIVLSVPNYLHAPLGIQVLEAGKHLLMDKPLAHMVEGARQLVAIARRRNLRLGILQDFRGDPSAQLVRSFIDSGDIGDIYFVRTVWHRRDFIPLPPKYGEWYTNSEKSGGGVLLDLGSHRLDLALWLIGFPQLLTASGAIYDHLSQGQAKKQGVSFSIEDTAVGFLRFTGGISVLVETSFAGYRKELEHVMLEIRGTCGGAMIRNKGNSYREYEVEIYGSRYGQQFDYIPVTYPPAFSLYEDFLRAIESNCDPLCSGEQGLRLLEILASLYASAKTSKEISF